MKMVICSIRDSAADAFGRPFYVPSVGVAIRSFTDEVNRPSEDNQIYPHPEDFDLFELGEFDDTTGRFVLLDVPKQLALGRMVKVRE